MKHILVLSLAIAIALSQTIRAADKKSSRAAIPDAVAQNGVWIPKAAVRAGTFLQEAAVKDITLMIKDATYEVSVKGEDHSDKGTFTIDTDADPKRMTIKSTEGPNAGKTFLAIYEMKGPGAMRVCYDLSGAAYPKEFKAPKGTDLYLVGYRRQMDPSSGKASPKK